MARIRSIHPSIWTDEDFVEMSAHARLFMLGLWNEADDYGVLEWRPTKLKMRLAPADAVDAFALMDEIASAGFIVRVERAGKVYAVIKNFRKWQRPKNPSAPIIEVDEEIARLVSLPDAATSTPALPQPAPSRGEISPQMEDGGGRRESNTEEPSGSSDAGASGRDRARDALISEGRPKLMAMGVSKGGAAAMIGRWLRDTGDDHARVLEAISRARDQCPHDPLAWITARLKEAANDRQSPDRNNVVSALRRIGEKLDAVV